MDNAKQHWKILQKLGNDLANRVREFMVIGKNGAAVIVATEDGQGFWLGKTKFGSYEWNGTKTANEPTPLNIPDLVQMAHGVNHILLLNKRGEIYAMGRNKHEQLGLGTDKKHKILLSPQLISCPLKFISVRCGRWHSLALTDDGKVWAWGRNDSGQVCVPYSIDSIPSPRHLLELDHHRVVAVEAGGLYSLALTDRGEVYAWGRNEWRQLGEGSGCSQFTPTLIPSPSPVKSMAAGCCHTLLLTQTGEVYACGRNTSGQLGSPTSTKSSASLVKVDGLPLISQISSHPATNLSIAMSYDQRCFVWGEMADEKSISTPRELPPFYSTVESPLSLFSLHRNTTHSVTIPETPINQLFIRMSQMFDNPETSDVQFVVEQRTIHAHRIILSNSSDYFARMFFEGCLAPKLKDPIVKVTIHDYSYQVFYAFLRFFYTDSLELHFDLLLEIFELATQYLVPDLQQLCLSRLRTTLTTGTCCHYYQLILQHQIPELEDFQQELVQFISTNFFDVIDSDAYQSMDAELCKKLTFAMAKQSS